MPHRINIEGDLGTTKVASDSYDIDNIYLTTEGWVYRHYKRENKTKWWDEIIVAGEVTADGSPYGANSNTPIVETNPAKLGLAGGVDADGNSVAAPAFETGGDSNKDFEYSSHQKYPATDPVTYSTAVETEGGGVPNLDSTGDGAGDTNPPADPGNGGDGGDSNGETPAQPIVP